MNPMVGGLMSIHLTTVRPDDSIRYAFRLLCARRIRHLLVMEDARMVGIVTDRDIRLALPALPFVADVAEMYLKLDDIKVRNVMTRDVVTVSPGTPLRDAVDVFLKHTISALPVVDETGVVGIFTETDALRALRKMLEAPVP